MPVKGQIGPCAGHEYEEELVSDESEAEDVLSDPNDLFASSDSEPETEPEASEDFAFTDHERRSCAFIDDEAQEAESDEEDADKGHLPVTSSANESDRRCSDTDSDSESGQDKAIRAPLQQRDFLDDEAREDNDIHEMYNELRGTQELSDCDDNSSF